MTLEKWSKLTPGQQILNIASELTRARICFEKQEKEYERHSLERVYELLELTIADSQWKNNARREWLRFREILGEWYVTPGKIPPRQFLKTLLSFHRETYNVEI